MRKARWFVCIAISLTLLVAPEAREDGFAGFDADVAKVAKDWKVVLSKGYGVRELGKTDIVDEHTLFAIGSTTKAMTSALVGMLVDEQKLGWDDPVIKHLPWFQLKDAAVTRELTVRDLLTHRS